MGWYSESELDPQPNATPTAAIIGAESSGNPDAVSKKGARGLMQIMPAAAKGMGIDPSTLSDPKVNVALGNKLYQRNLKLFNGDQRKALAAYNWGPGNVKLHPNESDWPKETQSYVNKIAGPREAAHKGHWVSEADLDPLPQQDQTEQGPLENQREYQARLAAEQFKQRRAASGQTIPQGIPTPEQEALQTPLFDPTEGPAGINVFKLAEEHPYITAGAIGAAMPPAWAVGLAGTVGAAGIGMAEQEAYMGLADLGMKIAGPNHPYVGLGIGALGPVLGGGGASLMTGLDALVKEARTAADEVQKQFWEAARKGATDQMATNTKDRAAAAADVAKEAAKRHDEIQKAYGDQAKENLKPIATEHSRAAAKIQAYADQLKAHADAIEKHGPAAEKLAREQAAKTEIERQRPEVLGRTPEETEAAMAPSRVEQATTSEPGGAAVPSPEQLARTHDFRSSFFDVRKKIFDENYGKRYEDFENRYDKLNVGKTPALGDTLHKWNRALEEDRPSGEPASAIRKLMNNAAALAGNPETDSFESGRIENVLAGRATPGVQSRFTKLIDDYAKKHGQGIGGDQMRDFAVEALGGTPRGEATIGKLRALRRDAQRFAESAPDATQARIAREIAASAAKDYEHAEGLPEAEVAKLHTLNEQYSHDVSTWSPKESSNIMSDREPARVIGGMIADPDLMDSFASNADEGQKLHIRNAIADWANMSHLSVAEVAQKVTPKVMTKLGFNLPPKAWLEMEPRDIELNEILRSNPMAQHAVGQAFADEMKNFEAKMITGLRTRGIKAAEDLGPQGRALAAQMRNAITPEQVRAVAQKIAALDPKQVAAEFAKGLQSPKSAAYEKYLEIAQKGKYQQTKSAFTQQVQNEAQRVTEASLAATEKVPTRAEAARKALMNAKPSKMEERMQRYSNFRLMLGLEMGLGVGVVTGRIPPYWLAGGAIAGAMKIPLAIRGATRAALTNPAIADLVWQAVKNPRNYRVVGKSAALIMQATLAQKIHEQQLKEQEQQDNQ